MKIQTRSVLTSLFLLTGIAFGLYRIVLIFIDSPDIGGIENSVIYFVQRILNGSSPYTNPELPPYSIAQYPPLYYCVDVFFARLTGVGPDDIISIFFINRTVGLVSNCLYLLSVFFISRRIFNLSTLKSLAISIFCFIFLESPSFARPDSLYLAMYSWSLFIFFIWIKKGAKRLDFLLIFCSVLAGLSLFVKQTAITLPLIIGSWLLLQKKLRSLVIFTSGYVLTLAVCLYLLHLQFGLPNVYKNIVLGINNGIGITWFWDFIVSYLFGSFGTVWILISVVLYNRMRQRSDEIHSFGRILLFSLFVFALLFSLKWGSWINYFTEWWTIVFILTGYYWDEIELILNQLTSYFSRLFIGSLLLIKLISITYPLYAYSKAVLRGNRFQYNNDKATADWVLTNIAKTGGFVFVNNSNVHVYLNNLLLKHSVLPQYEIVTYTLYDRHVFNYSDLRKSFQDGRVKYIITKAGAPGPKYMDNLMEHFHPVFQTGAYRVYRFN